MKNDIRLSIPKPCPAPWENMNPAEKGRFCELCSLTVVDFTKMSDQEIKEYFLCSKGQKTCGRFNASQLAQNAIPKNFAERLIQKTESHFRNTSIKTALFFGITLFAMMIGCKRPSLTPPTVVGELEAPVQYELMGEPLMEKNDTTNVMPVK